MRSYAIIVPVEEEYVNVFEASKEPLELSGDEDDDVFVGYSDLDWPFDINDPKNWKYWEGTERIYGFINSNTKEFKTYWELDKEFDEDIPEEYEECIKCQNYKEGKPIGTIYYE